MNRTARALESGVLLVGKLLTIMLNWVVFVILNVQMLHICRRGGL